MSEPEKIEYEGSVIPVTDAMGREVFWLDAGRPESTDK
jgi:hypothetical protein